MPSGSPTSLPQQGHSTLKDNREAKKQTQQRRKWTAGAHKLWLRVQTCTHALHMYLWESLVFFADALRHRIYEPFAASRSADARRLTVPERLGTVGTLEVFRIYTGSATAVAAYSLASMQDMVQHCYSSATSHPTNATRRNRFSSIFQFS